ncbi:MAG: HEAT repeat domain-containing protein, partial [Polyangiaceae bacterium]|nr:HEAT repeat domain-containing protein [Polyangiaceae bacterium]
MSGPGADLPEPEPRSAAGPLLAATLGALGADDAEERRQAAAALPELPPASAAPLLLQALGDPDWRVRKEAALAGRRLLELASEGDGERIVDSLLRALEPGENVGLRNAAIEVLGAHGRVVVPALARALAALDADGRKLAVEALGRTRDAAALGPLEGALADADDNVRQAAIEAIAALGVVARAPVLDVLRRALGDRDRFVRLTALHGLNALEAPVPWEELAPLLGDSMLRPAALTAAALAESPEAPAALVDALAGARGSAFAQIVGALSRLIDGPLLHIRGSGSPDGALRPGPLAPHAIDALRAGGPAVAARLVREASEPRSHGAGATEPPSWRGPGFGPTSLRGKALLLAAAARAPGAAEAAVQALAEPALAELAQRALLSLGPRALSAVLAHLAGAPDRAPRDGAPSAPDPAAAGDLEPDHVAALIDVAAAILSAPPAPDPASREELCAIIRRAVRSASTLVATTALYALARLGGEEDLRLAATQTLSAALPAARAAERALAALAERHPAAARALAAELMARVETYLPAAILLDALGAAAPDEVVVLAHAAASGDVRARRAAVAAAAAAGGPSALEVLSAALADEEREVQLAAARALGRLAALLDGAPDRGAGLEGDPAALATRAGELLGLLARSGDAELV